MSSINLNVLDWANAEAADRERVLTRNGIQQGLTRVTDLNRSIADSLKTCAVTATMPLSLRFARSTVSRRRPTRFGSASTSSRGACRVE